MLEDPQIVALMKAVSGNVLPKNGLLAVRPEPSVEEDGSEALKITLVLSHDAVSALDGSLLSRMLRELHDELLANGDERFPHLYFSTASEEHSSPKEAA